MKSGFRITVLAFLFSFACTVAFVHPTFAVSQTNAISGSIDLSGPWLMKDYSIGIGMTKHLEVPGNVPKDCMPYVVPGTVRTALLNAGEIPDPYYGYDNEKSLWVEEKEWWFFKNFRIEPQLKGKYIDLVFQGTSFQGEVWLNGQRIGELKGMLNPRAFDVGAVLNYDGENELVVRLEATPDARMNVMERGLTWDSPRNQLYSIAQCMYGWDWGPHGVPVGIWQPVKLRISGPIRVDHPYVRTQIRSDALAECSIDVDLHNLSGAPVNCELSGSIREKKSGKNTADFHQTIPLGAGETKTVSLSVKIADPKLWWPNGMGEQNLYLLNATVADGGRTSETVSSQFGVRELKLVENENIDEFLKTMKEQVGSQYVMGKVVGSYPWTFQINGRKMFAKGANWIPIDQLLRLDRSRYDRLLTLARDAGFNLLRVWGGGLYETDDFYELCDDYGILAWQEFLSNRSFSQIDRANFLDGATSAVLRLRNHPSLTFWCGGNEFDPDDAGSKSVIDALDSLLKKLDPQREFHRASPYQGDDHHWAVWHGLKPYTDYRVVRPFRSEAGMNTFPVPEDYRKFTPPSYLWPPDTTYIEYHGEYNVRFQHLMKLSRYADEFGSPTSTDDFIRKSQLYQALANGFNMEYCRENKFRNSGLLIWQYDDIWPCISWSMVDWYGTPKPSYYYMKRASRPIHVGADFPRYIWKAGEEFDADIYLLNDTYAGVKGLTYEVRVLGVGGETLASKNGSASAAENRSEKVGRISYTIPAELAGKSFFLSVELKGRGGALVSSIMYPIGVSKTGDLEAFKDLFDDMNAMPVADLKTTVKESAGGAPLKVMVSNPGAHIGYFIRVRLAEESSSLSTTYSDNYFTLLPGESTSVSVGTSATSGGTIPGKLHVEVSGWNSPTTTVEATGASK